MCIPNYIFDVQYFAIDQPQKTDLKNVFKYKSTLITVCLVLKGELQLHINENLRLFCKEDVFLINQPVDAKIAGDAEVCCVIFDRKIVSAAGISAVQSRILYQGLFGNKECLQTIHSNRATAILELLLSASSADQRSEFFISTFKIFLLEIIDSSAYQTPSMNSSRQSQLFIDFSNLVRTYGKTQRTVSYYANQLHLTPKYLSYVIKIQTGQTAGDYIADQLIIAAKELLNIGRYSIGQIADMLSFTDLHTFGKFFKRRTGFSPKTYALRLQVA